VAHWHRLACGETKRRAGQGRERLQVTSNAGAEQIKREKGDAGVLQVSQCDPGNKDGHPRMSGGKEWGDSPDGAKSRPETDSRSHTQRDQHSPAQDHQPAVCAPHLALRCQRHSADASIGGERKAEALLVGVQGEIVGGADRCDEILGARAGEVVIKGAREPEDGLTTAALSFHLQSKGHRTRQL
jgi:hypothetical protein